MNLSELMRGVTILENTAENCFVSSLSYDTRTLRPGGVYFALNGAKTDGHRFLGAALDRGAACVVCEKKPAEAGPWVVVPDSRKALALCAGNYFGHPARQMLLVGVTGTNGKTTTSYLLKTVLENQPGAKVGLVGTNQNMIGPWVIPTSRTTPESYDLQELLSRMADAGCTHVVMEVSSHALVQRRVYGLHFRVGVFTNLTQDHLDFHRTMEEYQKAKGLLFRQSATAVLNLDDPAGRDYQKTVRCPTFTYSENKNQADLTAKNIRLLPAGVEFEAVTRSDICRIALPIPGCFSIYNALATIGGATALGMSLPAIAGALAMARGVKGRAEVVPAPCPFTVLIDYAHSPDALENILTTARGFTKGRILLLFGCGGDRDKAKRPIMGAIGEKLADLCIVTSDNPRSEPPEGIIEEILSGMERGEKARVEPDRRAAIRLALGLAEPGDTVLLAGKGHETYQEIAGVQRHLDEREEIADYFRAVPAFHGVQSG